MGADRQDFRSEAGPVIALLCAGAAKGLVARIAAAFTAESGYAVDGAFDAVGALVDRLGQGARCDVIVLTAALIARLEKEGRVIPGSTAPLGIVATAVAVPERAPRPAIGDADSLRATLAAASHLHFPDPQRATAGIHFAGVLRRLGLDAEVGSRCRTYANGATAMAALAKAGPGDVGCTQATEILYTPGLTLVGPLPPGFELATVYAAAACRLTAAPVAAHRFIDWLAGPRSLEARAACGFAPAG
jgi:molybdate transport system substrate-binding protein